MLILLHILLENSVNVGKQSDSQWQIRVFQILSFYPKDQLLSLATNTFQLFFLKQQAHFIFEKLSARSLSLNNHSFSVVVLPNNCVPRKKCIVHLQLICTNVIPRDTGHSAIEVLYDYFPVSHTDIKQVD